MTENGCACPDDDVEDAKYDSFRVDFYQGFKLFGVLLSQGVG